MLSGDGGLVGAGPLPMVGPSMGLGVSSGIGSLEGEGVTSGGVGAKVGGSTGPAIHTQPLSQNNPPSQPVGSTP